MLSRYASAAVAVLIVFSIGGPAALAEENPVVAGDIGQVLKMLTDEVFKVGRRVAVNAGDNGFAPLIWTLVWPGSCLKWIL